MTRGASFPSSVGNNGLGCIGMPVVLLRSAKVFAQRRLARYKRLHFAARYHRLAMNTWFRSVPWPRSAARIFLSI